MTWTSLLERIERNVYGEARRALLSLAKEDCHARVLDCGCAAGGLAIELAARIGTQRLFGVDINEKMALQARGKGVRVAVTDLNLGLPFQDDTFDLVNASFVLEHLLYTDVLIRETRRVLKPGGYAIFIVPNSASAHNILLLLFGWQPLSADVSLEAYVGNPLNPRNLTERGQRKLAHLRQFTYAALKDLIEFHGLIIERLLGCGFYPFTGSVSRVLSGIDPRHSYLLILTARK